ncbi:hypothetical protein AB3S75_017868 [Citrus x aurantiifolia]
MLAFLERKTTINLFKCI